MAVHMRTEVMSSTKPEWPDGDRAFTVCCDPDTLTKDIFAALPAIGSAHPCRAAVCVRHSLLRFHNVPPGYRVIDVIAIAHYANAGQSDEQKAKGE